MLRATGDGDASWRVMVPDRERAGERAEKPTFGEVLRELRRARGWRQADLARATDYAVDTSEISRLETGKLQLPGPAKLRALAAALEVSAGQLLALSKWPDQPVFDERAARVLVRVRPDDEEILEGVARFLTDQDAGEVDLDRMERALDAARVWLREQRSA